MEKILKDEAYVASQGRGQRHARPPIRSAKQEAMQDGLAGIPPGAQARTWSAWRPNGPAQVSLRAAT